MAIISDFPPIEAAITEANLPPQLQYAVVGGLVPLLESIAERVQSLSPQPTVPPGYRSLHEYVLHTLIEHNREIKARFAANRKVTGASRKLYEIDLWCERLRLAIEVDGAQHFAARQKRRDEARDRDLAAAGIKTQKILASAVMADPTSALMLVRQTVDARLKELSR